MKICRDCGNTITGMIDFDGDGIHKARCRWGKRGPKYQSPITGEWKINKLPKCEDLNSDGKCENYNGHVK